MVHFEAGNQTWWFGQDPIERKQRESRRETGQHGVNWTKMRQCASNEDLLCTRHSLRSPSKMVGLRTERVASSSALACLVRDRRSAEPIVLYARGGTSTGRINPCELRQR